MRISDWSSDVCSSDLLHHGRARLRAAAPARPDRPGDWPVLRGVPVRHRPAHAVRVGAGDPAPAATRRPALAQAASAYLGPRPAAQDAVPHVAPLPQLADAAPPTLRPGAPRGATGWGRPLPPHGEELGS